MRINPTVYPEEGGGDGEPTPPDPSPPGRGVRAGAGGRAPHPIVAGRGVGPDDESSGDIEPDEIEEGREISREIIRRLELPKGGVGEDERFHRSGEVDEEEAWRVFNGSTDIFRRPLTPDDRHHHLYLLMDVSGSMSGRPISDLRKLAYAFVFAAEKLPHLTLNMRTFAHSTIPIDPTVDGVRGIYAGGDTNMVEGLRGVLYTMGTTPPHQGFSGGLLVVMTDGDVIDHGPHQREAITRSLNMATLDVGIGIGIWYASRKHPAVTCDTPTQSIPDIVDAMNRQIRETKMGL